MDKSNFIGFFNISKEINENFQKNIEFKEKKYIVGDNDIIIVEDFLSKKEINFLVKEINSNKNVEVGIDGIAKNYAKGQKIHSYRSTFLNDFLAEIFYARIKKMLSNKKNKYEEKNKTLTHYNINPLFRCIKYATDGILIPHYDFPYKIDINNLSLLSVIIYLTNNDEDGSTDFIKERRINDYTDLDKIANEKDILLSIKPKAGTILIFPHDILHQSKKTTKEKIIIRTDVMFRDFK